MRGGDFSSNNYAFSPANYEGQGQGLTEPSTNVQFAAGMSGGRRRRRMTRRGRSRRMSMGGARRRRTTRRVRRSRRSRR
jgi:hypothetical protein